MLQIQWDGVALAAIAMIAALVLLGRFVRHFRSAPKSHPVLAVLFFLGGLAVLAMSVTNVDYGTLDTLAPPHGPGK